MVLVTSRPSTAQVAMGWNATTATSWRSSAGCVPSSGSSSTASSETVTGHVTGLAVDGISLDASTAVAVAEPSCDEPRWAALGAVRASVGSPRWRLWIVYTAAHTGLADTLVRVPGLAAGLERRVGRGRISMSLGPRLDRTATRSSVELTPHVVPEHLVVLPGTTVHQETTYVAHTVNRLAARRVPDLGVALSWTLRGVGVGAAAQFGLAGDARRTDPLGRIEMSYDISPRVLAIATVVSRAAVPAMDLRSRHVASLGFRVGGSRIVRRKPNGSPGVGASAFRVQREANGDVTVAIRAVAATRVEMAADFTHWEPVDLTRAEGGWWQATVRIAPGTHQASVRVDGGQWSAPPGATRVHDEFGSTVGLLMVR